jgi:hypothetical protein
MSGYPAEWSRTDIDGAVAALAGAGVQVTRSDKRGRAVDFVSAGRPCRLSQYDAYGRGKWVRARFPWPARWPDILLTDPDDPDDDGDENLADPRPPAGFVLYSSDMAAARAVVGAGFAIAAREPRAILRMQRYPGACVESGSAVALNGASATWLVGLLGRLLAGAPPVSREDVTARLLADDADDPEGEVSGERIEVLHRMLCLIRAGLSEAVDADTAGEPGAVELSGQLERWIGQSAELAAARASGAADRREARAGQEQTVTEIAAALDRRKPGADAAGSVAWFLATRLRDLVEQARRWDEPDTGRAAGVAVDPSASGPPGKATPNQRWWRRGS